MTAPLKIHASRAGMLMTEPKLKTDKDNGNLSEGAKTFIRELWIKKTYNRRKDIANKYIEKGLLNEETSIDFVSMHFNEMFEKNTKLFSDNWFIGEPDILPDMDIFIDYVFDNKCSWDIYTFMDAELTKLYEAQLQVYMHLTGRRKAKLIYCLTDAPEATIQRELKSAMWKLQSSALPELEENLRKNLCYDDIPLRDKVKIFDLEYDAEYMERLIKKVERAREYYSTLKL